jgi:cytochrome P450
MDIITADDDGHADISNHDTFVDGPPHRTFARMRREDPCAWTEMKDGLGYWSITRHHDIGELNRNYELMSSGRGIRMEDQTYDEYLARRTFQETDPPEHTRTRVLVAKAFSKPVVAQFEGQIRRLCDEILDAALQSQEFDAVQAIARQLPMRMLGQIIGTPDEDLPWLVQKGDSLIANTDPDFTQHVLDKLDSDAYRMLPFRSPAGVELYDYAAKLMARKHATGDTSGVLNMILQPDSAGNVMSEREFGNFFCLLVAAGNDTTRYSIVKAFHVLANRPDLMEALREGAGDIWETAPDEFIRMTSPALYFRRTATRDAEIHGKQIKAGDKVLLWFVSGNHDETVFADPFVADLRRSPNRHFAFGQGGPHVCLGMWLARLEVRLLLQAFVARVKTLEQTGPHAHLRSNFVGGIKRLPVRVILN